MFNFYFLKNLSLFLLSYRWLAVWEGFSFILPGWSHSFWSLCHHWQTHAPACVCWPLCCHGNPWCRGHVKIWLYRTSRVSATTKYSMKPFPCWSLSCYWTAFLTCCPPLLWSQMSYWCLPDKVQFPFPTKGGREQTAISTRCIQVLPGAQQPGQLPSLCLYDVHLSYCSALYMWVKKYLFCLSLL